MGGVQTQILTPPPPRETQSVQEVRTTFVPNLAPETFFWHPVGGGKIDFTLRVYAPNTQNFIGNSNMHGSKSSSVSSLLLYVISFFLEAFG